MHAAASSAFLSLVQNIAAGATRFRVAAGCRWLPMVTIMLLIPEHHDPAYFSLLFFFRHAPA